MPDIALIGSTLSSIKTAWDIAKALKDADVTLEKAEWKFKLAEMISALADAKISTAEFNELLAEKDRQIAELHLAFESKDELVKNYDAYYAKDKNGRATGEPYCMACWNIHHKKFHLHHKVRDRHTLVCTSCKREYSDRTAGTILPDHSNLQRHEKPA